MTMAKDNRLHKFYQHPYEGHEMIFSGQFFGSSVPNFTLKKVLNYADLVRDFKFYLILRNNVTLSIIKEKGYSYFEVAQIINDKMTKKPCFDADEWGITTKYPAELLDLVHDLVINDTYGMNYVEGA